MVCPSSIWVVFVWLKIILGVPLLSSSMLWEGLYPADSLYRYTSNSESSEELDIDLEFCDSWCACEIYFALSRFSFMRARLWAFVLDSLSFRSSLSFCCFLRRIRIWHLRFVLLTAVTMMSKKLSPKWMQIKEQDTNPIFSCNSSSPSQSLKQRIV